MHAWDKRTAALAGSISWSVECGRQITLCYVSVSHRDVARCLPVSMCCAGPPGGGVQSSDGLRGWERRADMNAHYACSQY